MSSTSRLAVALLVALAAAGATGCSLLKDDRAIVTIEFSTAENLGMTDHVMVKFDATDPVPVPDLVHLGPTPITINFRVAAEVVAEGQPRTVEAQFFDKKNCVIAEGFNDKVKLSPGEVTSVGIRVMGVVPPRCDVDGGSGGSGGGSGSGGGGGSSGTDGGGGDTGDGGTVTPCQRYCAELAAACPTNVEVDGGSCETVCTTLFPPSGVAGTYDPIACREAKLPGQCAAGGFWGENLCGVTCPANASCSPGCDVYCHFADVACQGLYGTENECLTACMNTNPTQLRCHVSRLIQIASGQAVSCDSAALSAACQ